MSTEVRQIAITMAKTESTPGTYEAPTAAANVFWTYDSKIPYDAEFRSTVLEQDTGTYTAGLDLPGPYIAHPQFNVALMGSGTADVAPLFGPILKAIGLTQTISAGVSVVYTVPTSATAALTPCTVVSDIDGLQYQSYNVIGQTATFSGEAVGRSTLRFRGFGKARGAKYTGDTGFISVASPTFPTDRTKQFLSNALSTITPSGRAAIAPVGFGFDLDMGLRIAEVISYNASPTFGLHAVYTVAIRPRLTVRIAVNKDVAAGNTMKQSQIEADIAAQTPWALHYELGSQSAGSYVQVDVPTGQPIGYSLVAAPGGEIVGVNVNVKVQSSTPGSEITFTFK